MNIKNTTIKFIDTYFYNPKNMWLDYLLKFFDKPLSNIDNKWSSPLTMILVMFLFVASPFILVALLIGPLTSMLLVCLLLSISFLYDYLKKSI